jgi:hypothetical protein
VITTYSYDAANQLVAEEGPNGMGYWLVVAPGVPVGGGQGRAPRTRGRVFPVEGAGWAEARLAAWLGARPRPLRPLDKGIEAAGHGTSQTKQDRERRWT